MNDVEMVRPGDLLIGFSQYGPCNVVSNRPGRNGGRDLVIAFQDNSQLTVNVRRFGEHVRVLKSRW